MLCHLVLCIHLIGFVLCFNFDLDHAIIIENPDLSQDKSYFGYSVVLYSNASRGVRWIKVGAPKATYAKDIQQSGLVYHCPYMDTCGIERKLNYSSYKNFDRKVDLTTSMAGGSMDISSKLRSVAISTPNWSPISNKTAADKNSPRYSSKCRGGLFVENFENQTWKSISPLKRPYKDEYNASYYAGAMSGFSMHFIEDKNELLIGAPGVYTFKGTVLKIKNIGQDQSQWKYKIKDPSGEAFEYSGYSLASGYFLDKDELLYVTGQPRGAENFNSYVNVGSILVFAFGPEKGEYSDQFRAAEKGQFYGDQFGEYFGASLAAGDLNGDELHDIIVGAPYRKNYENGYNHGSVYVIYGNKKILQKKVENRIDGNVTNGLFGSAMMFLGNLHDEKYGAFAVSASNEDTSGVVYIYTYDERNKRPMISQRISGKQIYPGLRGFGASFSRPTDIDNNHFPDIAIGSPISGHVVILRNRPIVSVTGSIEGTSRINGTLSFKCCLVYTDYLEESLTIARTIKIDGDIYPERYSFNSSDSGIHSEEKELKIMRRQKDCEKITVFKNTNVKNYTDPIGITLTYRIPENRTASKRNVIFISSSRTKEKDTFCEKCPILDPRSLNSVTKRVVWDETCRAECVSELIVSAMFSSLSKTDTYILGSLDPINLTVTVQNYGNIALMSSLEINLPTGVNLRKKIPNCDNGKITKIICDIEELRKKEEVTFTFELNIDESITETRLVFSLNISTITKNIADESSFNKTLQIDRKADFEITGESKESNYAYLKETPVFLENIFKITKFGPSPMPEIEAIIVVPYKIRDSEGTYHQFADIRQLQDANKENPLAKCGNMTDYKVKRRRKRSQIDVAPPENASFQSIRNNTYALLDPAQIFNLNCTMESVKCAQIKCQVGPFEDVHKYVEVAIGMKANFSAIEDMLETKDTIVITMTANIHIANFTQSGNRSDHAEVFNLLLIKKEHQVSLWIIIGSAVVGFILLVVLSICLAKAGFFERKEQQKLKLIKEEALEEERILEALIKREIENGNFTEEEMEENPYYGIIRYRGDNVVLPDGTPLDEHFSIE